MAVKKKTTPKKKQQHKVVALLIRAYEWALKRPFLRAKKRFQNFMKRRTHRSFRKTYKRDMPKLVPLPSNIFFTAEVFGIMRRNKKAFLSFTALYVALYTLLGGLSSENGYKVLSEGLKEVGPNVVGGQYSEAAQTITLFGAAATGALNDPLSEAQQVYLALLGIFMWLSIVWYLRHRLAGAKVKIRDALYNSGAPLLSTAVLAIVLLFQSIPGVASVTVYFTLLSSGVIQGGIESMMFAIAALLMVVLSLYWMTSTLLALIIVTLPGTYPMKALSIAGDVVIGRRVSLLIRSVWLVFVLLLVWMFILIPVILLADFIPWDFIPVVPLTIQILTGWSFLFFATYVYLLYRRMIDEPAKK
jgi:hypothetical protein